jgi:hypothetical protein
MSDRRFTDEEVQQILAAAAQSEGAERTTSDAESGMTLAELQRVASEAGLSSTAIAKAAAALDHKSVVLADPRILGLKTGVAQSVTLSRPLSDVEWRKVVAVLRDTFAASGREEQVEGRREWRNGNLRVTLESVGDGAWLEMRTQKESARGLVRSGLAIVGVSAIVEVVLAVTGANAGGMAGVLTTTLAGAGMAAFGALQLPTWLSARRRQFAAIAEYVQQIANSDHP